MISTASAQTLPAAPAPMQAASSPVAAAQIPATIAQTIQPQINMPPPPTLAWWEIAGVLPSIAAVVSVVVTALGLWWNTGRQINAAREALTDQLEDGNRATDRKIAADNEKDRLNRITTARQDIYGEIFRDYQKVQELIGGLADSDPEVPVAFSPIGEMSSGINKLWIWGEVNSVLAVREFYTQVNEMAYEARGRAEAIRELKLQARELDKKHKESIAAYDEVVQEMALLTARNDEGLHFADGLRSLDNLKQARDLNLNAADESSSQFGNLNKTIALRQQAYLNFIVMKQDALMVQVNKVMALARADVGLTGDVTELEEQSSAMSQRVLAAIYNMRDSRLRELARAEVHPSGG